MAQRVFSFVGQNANGILAWWTQSILDRMTEFGISSELFYLFDPDLGAKLAAALAVGKPTMGFSFQGFGSSIKVGNRSLWDMLDVPFVSNMGDAPYHAPSLHAVGSQRQALLYASEDFLDTYKRYFAQKSFAALLSFGFPANPYADAVPWEKRRHAIAFIKTGVNPADSLSRWANVPLPLRDVLIDAAVGVLSGTNHTVAQVCEQAFDAHKIVWGHRPEFFYRVCSEVDMYVRAVRADLMVRHLMRHDAVIFGDWDYLDKTTSRASFRGLIHASELHSVYADTKIVVNTSPSVRSGTHERIMSGMLSKCAVLSDSTPFLDRELGHLPSFAGVDIDHAGYKDRVDEAIDRWRHASDVEPAFEFATAAYSIDRFITNLFQFVEIEHFGQESSFYRFHSPELRHDVVPLETA